MTGIDKVRTEISEELENILTDDLVMESLTHENAPPGKDCCDDCGVLHDGNDKKHRKCMDCWEEYVKGLTLRILKKLVSKGVVIPVEKELLDPASNYKDDWLCGYRQCRKDMLEAGYVAVEPLIKKKPKMIVTPLIRQRKSKAVRPLGG